MKNVIIVILGIVVNLLVFNYAQATKEDIGTIVPKIYLFFIIPLLLLVAIIASVFYNYYRHKKIICILPKLLIACFLLVMLIQYLLFSNDVLVK
jgi:hypothetical protein